VRDTNAWHGNLSKDIRAYYDVYGKLDVTPNQILDTELVLTLMREHFPEQQPDLAWAVLNGHAFPKLLSLPEASLRAIAITRMVLPEPLGRTSWNRWLADYERLPQPYPLYRIDGTSIVLTETALLAHRLEVMRSTLQQPPPWKQRPAKYAGPGTYTFTLDRQTHEVTIPGDVTPGASLSIPPGRTTIRPPLRVSLNELIAEADWMDQVLTPNSQSPRRWGQFMQDSVRLQLVTNQGLQPTNSITVEGLLHLVGMVGSGKSTLLTVLAVYLARRGQRVVLLQSDVASLLREHEIFTKLRAGDPRIHSVPLVGRTTRTDHLNRLTIAEASQHGLSLSRDHAAYAMLSTICPLDGLRRDVEPIPAGKEPCTRLYRRGVEETEANRYDCPFMPVCPVHRPTHELVDATIWLATPASLLASSPQVPLISEHMRNVELVMRAADVVLVDEADLVQIQFDDRFAQIEVLVGREDSWLDRLATQVARQVYRPGRPIVGTNNTLDRWLTAHTNTQRAVDRLYRWLRESLETRMWLGQSYYSGARLFQMVGEELTNAGASLEVYNQAVDVFRAHSYGSVRVAVTNDPLPLAWERALNAELFTSQAHQALTILIEWLRETSAFPPDVDTNQLEGLAHHLRIALLLGVLDHALRDVIAEWPTAAAMLELDRGSGGLFFAPSDSLVRMVPEAPMGAILGFQYFDPDNRGDGDLRFFHVRGVGRALLYHLHDGLHHTDGIVGPHVILTSATSVAPSSWRYHLHVPPQMLLLPSWYRERYTTPDDEDEQTQERKQRVECIVDFLSDPAHPEKSLAISQGLPPAERVRRLRAMIARLTEKSPIDQKSRFDRELELLPENRKRILIVVGRYDEAAEVEAALTELLRAQPGEHAVALIPDRDTTSISEPRPNRLYRSRIAHFTKTTATFLIAPIQSIERGHNIVVGHEAAIGSVYFLVRPIPVPGDPHTAVQRLNTWALQMVEELTDIEATAAGKRLRTQATQRWDKALRTKETYRGSKDRDPLLWTQLVLVWQSIGRLLRGGTNARVHFVDAKWAEVRSGLLSRRAADTEETSMLVGFRRILRDALANPDVAQREIIQALYGVFAEGLERMEV
jgi:tRNA uridine 5-carbamoylmethylation protein Kti12